MKKIIIVGLILVFSAAAFCLSVERRAGPEAVSGEEISEQLAALAAMNGMNTHDLPALFSIIDIERMPEELAYQQETHQIKFFAPRAPADAPPVMLVAVDEYRGELNVTEAVCAGRFLSVRMEDDRRETGISEEAGEKWLKRAKKETFGGATVWTDYERLLMKKDGTIVRAELLDKGFSREFAGLSRGIRIK